MFRTRGLKSGKILLIITVVIVCSGRAAIAGERHEYKESIYRDAWCARMGGVTEYVLDDRTRVDCLTPEYAVEVEFAEKWAEAIGQSLYYGIKTGRIPAVLFIIEHPYQDRFLARLRTVAALHEIIIWIIRPAELASK